MPAAQRDAHRGGHGAVAGPRGLCSCRALCRRGGRQGAATGDTRSCGVTTPAARAVRRADGGAAAQCAGHQAAVLGSPGVFPASRARGNRHAPRSRSLVTGLPLCDGRRHLPCSTAQLVYGHLCMHNRLRDAEGHGVAVSRRAMQVRHVQTHVAQLCCCHSQARALLLPQRRPPAQSWQPMTLMAGVPCCRASAVASRAHGSTALAHFWHRSPRHQGTPACSASCACQVGTACAMIAVQFALRAQT